MASTNPYLKLHSESPSTPPTPTDYPGVQAISRSLSEATGWQFAFQTPKPSANGWEPAASGAFVIESPAGEERMRRKQAEEVAESLNEVLTELHQTRHALWQREAELAAGVPIVPRADEALHLAARLESALEAGAAAIGCDAAAVYQLDDATTSLKMRSAWGMPKSRLLEPARELRGAVADLEALIGHVVALEDATDLTHWKCPESEFGAALCVPVSTPSTPLGTLWFFSRGARHFSDTDTNLAEIIAGRVGADLEREILIAQGTASKQLRRQLQHAGQWFTRRLPMITPLTDDWDVGGIRLDDSPSGEFYDWSVLADGRLSFAVGDCAGVGIDALLNAAAFQSAFHSHRAHRHSPSGLLRRVNETLWSSSPGDMEAALAYAVVDEVTGRMEYAWAGNLMAIAIRGSRFRSLLHPTSSLGSDPDLPISTRKHRVAHGELLILLTESVRHAPLRSGGSLSEADVARAVRGWQEQSADQITRHLAGWLSEQMEGGSAPKACLTVIKRRDRRAR